MNKLDLDYQNLLKDILENGVKKNTRNGEVLSIFGRTIRYKFKDGKFPLLTTKKMAWKQIVTELLWFLRGDTNIKYLVDNGCNIWNGDAYRNYISKGGKDFSEKSMKQISSHFSQEDFINKIKTDDEFAKKWGSLGSIYGKQWRSWAKFNGKVYSKQVREVPEGGRFAETRNVNWVGGSEVVYIDQIANLINDLKTNPDSRRLMVNAWNPADLPNQVLPPCHYGFQMYTRELSVKERLFFVNKSDDEYNKALSNKEQYESIGLDFELALTSRMNELNIPTRAISLMFNMRSIDTFLGLPFNIASYGLLLEIIAKAVNMVPDELIGNLGDVHLYSNHVEQAKEQIGRELSLEEVKKIYIDWSLLKSSGGYAGDIKADIIKSANQIFIDGWKNNKDPFTGKPLIELECFLLNSIHTRQPYPLPTLNINTEFWPYEGGECGVGLLDAVKVFESFKDDNFCRCLLEEDIQLSNYQSHPSIKAPLSN
jgi:thymidylate synthase